MAASSSDFDAKSFQWVAQLPQVWESRRPLRERSLQGRNLLRGMIVPGHGDHEVVIGSIECCKINSEVLLITLKLMADEACIFVPKVFLLQGATLEFHCHSGYPDAASLGVAAYSDGWGLKRMLTCVKRKWMRGQTPRVVGDRLARALRAGGDDDDIDDPADSAEAPTTTEPKQSTSEVLADLDLPTEIEEPEDQAAMDVDLPVNPVPQDKAPNAVVPETAPVNPLPEDKAPNAVVPETAPVNPVPEDKAPDAVVPETATVNQVPEDKGSIAAMPTNPEDPRVKDPSSLPPRQPSQQELQQQLVIAELKMEAQRLMAIERKRAAKQFAKTLPTGPIQVDSDEEANPGSVMPAVAACASKGGATNPDAMETQAFEVNTQVVAQALLGLDQTVPSPGRRFAEDKTMVLSPASVDVKSPADSLPVDKELHTPTPHGIVPADITPMKEYPTRDQQLACKTGNEAKKKADQAASKASKEAKEASRGRGRGRGGRGRGGGRGQKSTPEADDGAGEPVNDKTTEVPEKIEETQPKKKPGRRKKAQCELSEPDQVAGKAGSCEPSETKSKGGRSKTEVAVPKSKRTKRGNVPQEAAVPASRVRGKRSADEKVEPKAKRAQTISGMEWPNTFARRYRPAKSNITQKFWEGCVCAFRNVLMPHLVPGTATSTQSTFFDFAKQFVELDEQQVFVLCILLLLWNTSIDFTKDVDLAELFSGSATLSKEFFYEGKEVAACDYKYGHSVQQFFVVAPKLAYG
ncbi:unnamed protein product [Symbiodinium necroappetens]|uniref:Uncharacterized protein n=1 Tax=Symbiodinium necroappetens TaxID=1628268 RepID=A0A812S9T4_9DINO|nr:unnamed protein product [Symbiodinium necroappetens]